MEIIREILQPNLEASSNESNRSNEFAAHRSDLMAEDMFDASANARATPIMDLLLSGQGLAPIPFSVNLGAQPCSFEVVLDRVRPIGGVGPDIASGLRGQQHLCQDLTVMDRRIGAAAWRADSPTPPGTSRL